MVLKELALVLASTVPAEELPKLDIKGDLTAKSRVSQEIPNSIQEEPTRYRLNFLATLNGKWQLGGRQDASVEHLGTGYGALFARRKVGKGTAVGVGVMNDLGYDATKGEWDTDRSLGLHAFHTPSKGLGFFAHFPGGVDKLQVGGQYRHTFGENGPSIRVFAKDNVDVPRLQKLEIEASSPPVPWLGGGRITVQYNRVGTPNGSVDIYEMGVRKSFAHRRK